MSKKEEVRTILLPGHLVRQEQPVSQPERLLTRKETDAIYEKWFETAFKSFETLMEAVVNAQDAKTYPIAFAAGQKNQAVGI